MTCLNVCWVWSEGRREREGGREGEREGGREAERTREEKEAYSESPLIKTLE